MTKKSVFPDVVDGGYCIGCGICAAVCPRHVIAIHENSYGELSAASDGECSMPCGICVRACPMSASDDENASYDETSIAARLFGTQNGICSDPFLGYYHGTYVAAVHDDNSRVASASGGMATLVLKTLLAKGDVDAVVVPQPVRGRPWFEMAIVDSAAAVERSRGSVYHQLEWSRVLREIVSGPERKYAVIGVPCVIKGIRLAGEVVPQLKKRVRFALGLTCGGYRSLSFPDVMSLLCGVDPVSLTYRDKRGARRASDFSLVMRGDHTQRDVPWSSLYGFLFENGYAVPKGCLFCDDVFAECADVTFMDAWLPEFSTDARGTSLVIVRNDKSGEVLRSLADEGLCHWEPLAPERVIRSQRGVVRKKRDGLSARIQAATETGYCPKKRSELMPPLDKRAIASAHAELAAWREGRELASAFARDYRGRWGLRGRIAAWLHAIRFARLLRRNHMRVYKMRALCGLGRLPIPRLLRRSAKT